MRWRSTHLPLLLFVLFLSIGTVLGFRICSYNVKKLTPQKASNYRVMHTLTRIVSRCDICLLQDVRDPAGTAINSLMGSLNRNTDRLGSCQGPNPDACNKRYEEDHHYKSVSSKGLGASANNLEQYVFIYRNKSVTVMSQHQYGNKPSFTRSPFVIQVQTKGTAIKNFILVPLHTDSSKAIQELNNLYDIFEDISQKWNNTNVMFLGDFHAACAYVTRADKKKIRLFTDTKFSWLIRDKMDTTVSDNTNCAYDRIVVHGKPFLKAIIPFSAKVFQFGKEFKLSRSKVLDLSDHYPVEFQVTWSLWLWPLMMQVICM
uniref:Deoxyribonuclease n=1 Tax=Echeneis naucrates TaxID=173247 RepID=A0A665U3K4_ECHNA